MTLYPAEANHQRILTDAETAAMWKGVASAWGIAGHYWWPLSEPRPPHAEAFQDYYFEHEFGYPLLRQILGDHGNRSAFEFREDGKGYEVDIASIEPCYTGLEGFWTSAGFDWVLYACHEGAITVCGSHLMPAVLASWPSWRSRVWTTPFYERPRG